MTLKWGSDLPALRETPAFERWRFAQGALRNLPPQVSSDSDSRLVPVVSEPSKLSAKRKSDCVATAAKAREFSRQFHAHLNSLRDITKLEYDCYTAWKTIVVEEAHSRAEVCEAWHSNHVSEWMHKFSACVVEESAARSRVMDVFYEYQEWVEEKLRQSEAAARDAERRRVDHEASVRRAMAELQHAALREEAARQAALEELRLQEARLRQAQLAAEQKRVAEKREAERALAMAEAQREAERRQIQEKLDEEERLVQSRIQQRHAVLAEAERRREDERRALLQRVAAEEEALKQKLQRREQEISQQRREEQSRLLAQLITEEQQLTERLSQRERRASEAREDVVARLQREERRLREVIAAREQLQAEEERLHAESRAMLLEHCKAEEQILEERRRRRVISPQAAAVPGAAAAASSEPEVHVALPAPSSFDAVDGSDLAHQLAFVRAQEEKLARRLAARTEGSTGHHRDLVQHLPLPPPPPPYSTW